MCLFRLAEEKFNLLALGIAHNQEVVSITQQQYKLLENQLGYFNLVSAVEDNQSKRCFYLIRYGIPPTLQLVELDLTLRQMNVLRVENDSVIKITSAMSCASSFFLHQWCMTQKQKEYPKKRNQPQQVDQLRP